MVFDNLFDLDRAVGSFFECVFLDVVFEFDYDVGVWFVFGRVFVNRSGDLKVCVE